MKILHGDVYAFPVTEGDWALRVFRRAGEVEEITRRHMFHDSAVREAFRMSARLKCSVEIYTPGYSDIFLRFEMRVTAGRTNYDLPR